MEILDTQTLEKYRKEHPRCRYCIYHKIIVPPIPYAPSIHECILKDKHIRVFTFSGILCRWYEMSVKK